MPKLKTSLTLKRQERVKFLLNEMSKGIKGRSALMQKYTKVYPDLCTRTFDGDYKYAKVEVLEWMNEDKVYNLSELLKHHWDLYYKLYEEEDWINAKNVLKEIAALRGDSAPTVTVQQVEVKKMPEWFEDE